MLQSAAEGVKKVSLFSKWANKMWGFPEVHISKAEAISAAETAAKKAIVDALTGKVDEIIPDMVSGVEQLAATALAKSVPSEAVPAAPTPAEPSQTAPAPATPETGSTPAPAPTSEPAPVQPATPEPAPAPSTAPGAPTA